MVDDLDLTDAMNAVYRRVDDHCLYGDFQFVIDPQDDTFLQRGVFACYKPTSEVEAPGTVNAASIICCWKYATDGVCPRIVAKYGTPIVVS